LRRLRVTDGDLRGGGGVTNTTVTRTKWLRFEREDSPKRKTPVVWVYSASGDDYLGSIRWYPQWRQFCLVVEHDSYEPLKLIYAKSCLDDITEMIEGLTRERSGTHGSE
jgi:hypothetical protein